MSNDDGVRRHSVAQEATLISDEQARAEKEAANGLLQFDLASRIIQQAIERSERFRLRPSVIQALHREALNGLSLYAGLWRPASVEIEGSQHNPVGAHLVAEKIEELCDYVNENWDEKSALHLSAYVMWRLNWIHPFSDGNGRTSRILSYLVLSIRMGMVIPGVLTIPDQIVENRMPYFDALEDADAKYESGVIDVSKMDTLLSSLLAKQLWNIHDSATRNKP